MDDLIRKARAYHSNISEEYFMSLSEKQLMAWIHPIDRKNLSYKSVMESKYENIFNAKNKGGRPSRF